MYLLVQSEHVGILVSVTLIIAKKNCFFADLDAPIVRRFLEQAGDTNIFLQCN